MQKLGNFTCQHRSRRTPAISLQVCVAPGARGAGLGYELVRQSLMALALHGCRLASLTVTASNAAAIQLYRRMGFVNRRDFAAYVWEPR